MHIIYLQACLPNLYVYLPFHQSVHLSNTNFTRFKLMETFIIATATKVPTSKSATNSNWIDSSCVDRSRFIIGMSRIQISARRQVVMTYVHRDFLWTLQANSGIVPQIRAWQLLSTSLLTVILSDAIYIIH